jgi:phosphohistidine phosphatase
MFFAFIRMNLYQNNKKRENIKTLIIIRHAKSGWDNPDLMDFERPLNNRGRHDAPIIAKILKEKITKPDLILSSPAVRAYSTAEYFAAEFEFSENDIQLKKEIYENGVVPLLKLIQNIEDGNKIVMLIGHNPTVSLFTTNLTGRNMENIPTCGVVGLEFDVDSWSKVKFKSGKIVFFEYPRKHIDKKTVI